MTRFSFLGGFLFYVFASSHVIILVYADGDGLAPSGYFNGNCI